MTAIGRIVRQAAPGRGPQQNAPAAPSEAKPTGRELVPVTAPELHGDDARKPSLRGSASFLAQLIANENQLPQTRERRRAEPQVALAAYGAAAGLMQR